MPPRRIRTVKARPSAPARTRTRKATPTTTTSLVTTASSALATRLTQRTSSSSETRSTSQIALSAAELSGLLCPTAGCGYRPQRSADGPVAHTDGCVYAIFSAVETGNMSEVRALVERHGKSAGLNHLYWTLDLTECPGFPIPESYDILENAPLLTFACKSKEVAMVEYVCEELGCASQATEAQSSIRMKWTPLNMAAAVASPGVCTFLVRDLKADPNGQSRHGDARHTVYNAATRGTLHIVGPALLELGADLVLSSRHGRTALHQAACYGHLADLTWILDHVDPLNLEVCDNDGLTPFLWACIRGNLEACQQLKEHGAKATAVTKNGQSALHLCTETAVATWLLDECSPSDALEIRDNYGYTPFLEACREGRLEMCKLLEQRGAMVDVKAKSHKTPLYVAAVRDESFELCHWLCEECGVQPLSVVGSRSRSKKPFPGDATIACLDVKDSQTCAYFLFVQPSHGDVGWPISVGLAGRNMDPEKRLSMLAEHRLCYVPAEIPFIEDQECRFAEEPYGFLEAITHPKLTAVQLLGQSIRADTYTVARWTTFFDENSSLRTVEISDPSPALRTMLCQWSKSRPTKWILNLTSHGLVVSRNGLDRLALALDEVEHTRTAWRTGGEVHGMVPTHGREWRELTSHLERWIDDRIIPLAQRLDDIEPHADLVRQSEADFKQSLAEVKEVVLGSGLGNLQDTLDQRDKTLVSWDTSMVEYFSSVKELGGLSALIKSAMSIRADMRLALLNAPVPHAMLPGGGQTHAEGHETLPRPGSRLTDVRIFLTDFQKQTVQDVENWIADFHSKIQARHADMSDAAASLATVITGPLVGRDESALPREDTLGLALRRVEYTLSAAQSAEKKAQLEAERESPLKAILQRFEQVDAMLLNFIGRANAQSHAMRKSQTHLDAMQQLASIDCDLDKLQEVRDGLEEKQRRMHDLRYLATRGGYGHEREAAKREIETQRGPYTSEVRLYRETLRSVASACHGYRFELRQQLAQQPEFEPIRSDIDKWNDLVELEPGSKDEYRDIQAVRASSADSTKNILTARLGGQDSPRHILKEYHLGNSHEVPLRYKQEIRALRAISSHPFVCTFERAFIDRVNNCAVIQLEFYPGGDLATWLSGRDDWSAKARMDVIRQVMRHVLLGLCHAHDNGIVHSDIKPSNIFVDDSASRAKRDLAPVAGILGDFDVSRAIERQHNSTTVPTATVAPGGFTPLFAAPEVLSGQGVVTQAADMWSFGKTLFEVTRSVHPGWTLEDEEQEQSGIEISRDLFDVIKLLTAADPASRPSARDALRLAFFSAHKDELGMALAEVGSAVSPPNQHSLTPDTIQVLRADLVLQNARLSQARADLDARDAQGKADLREKQELSRQLDSLREQVDGLGMCSVCFEGEDLVRFDPCGHVVCCQRCATSITQGVARPDHTALCPVCKCQVSAILQRVFLAVTST